MRCVNIRYKSPFYNNNIVIQFNISLLRTKEEWYLTKVQYILYNIPVFSSFTTYHGVCNQINTTGVTSGAGTAYPSGAPEFTPGFQWGSCYSIFSFICMFSRSLFDLLPFFFWPLCCLSFFDIRILITSFWYLLAIVLSVLLRYTDSDYPFGIF